MKSRILIAAVIVPTMAVALLTPVAAADTPPLLNWGEVIPGFHPGLDTSDSNICRAGHDRCVQSVLRTMARDFRKLARTCDHDAVFQLGYMRTTEAYYESSQIPGFYDDVPWMHHYDAVFAEYYLGPQRAWARGHLDEVPPVWQQAFAAADAEELTVLGSFLMGMNAHINRDLPFVLADIGLTDADGNSRKPDHEKVNEFLNHVGDDLSPEMTARFDPNWDTTDDDDVVTGFTVQQIIQEWRERAWSNAWLMTYAPDPIPQLVAEGIETASDDIATTIRSTMAASPDQRDARNAYCDENWNNWDGGDGTYFDGEEEPLVEHGSFAPVVATTDLALLASLGVDVEASLALGISITVQDTDPL